MKNIKLKAANDNVVVKLINNDISKINNLYVVSDDDVWYAEVIDKGENVKDDNSYEIGDVLILVKNPGHYIFRYENGKYVIIDNREIRGIIPKDDFEEFVKNIF